MTATTTVSYTAVDEPPHQLTAFAHPSEQHFAALLDSYNIDWLYEPRMFVLQRDAGGIRRAFTPDFYLPVFDLYIEVTTLQQKLVTKKNRKIRELREQYPEIRLLVLYRRDLAALAARHDMVHETGPLAAAG